MSARFVIQAASFEDAAAISTLMLPLVKKFITHEFSAEAQKIMLDSMQPGIIEENFKNNYQYLIARDTESDAQIVGVLGMKTASHLFHLFVEESHHGNGIAKLLWRHLLEDSTECEFTVNASRYAQHIYKKLGFSGNGKLFEKNGITCFPMTYSRTR